MSNEDSYLSSDQLAALDSEIADTTARLDAIGRERGAALNDRAAGTEGAAETLESLRSERNSLQDYLSDLREAREIEVERLRSAHTDALSNAKQQRRDAIESARKDCITVAGKIDKAVDKVLAELAGLELAGSSLAQVHQNGAGNALVREAIEVIKERIAEYDRSNPDAGKKVASRMPGADLIESASIPNTLDKLNG